MNYYQVLGIEPTATKAEIKRAFREAAKELHPDHNPSPEAAKEFKRIKEAHDALLRGERPRETSSAKTATTTSTTQKPEQAKPQMSPEELRRIQELDELARQKPKRKSLFRRVKESNELRRHRRKIKTNEKRLRGEY